MHVFLFHVEDSSNFDPGFEQVKQQFAARLEQMVAPLPEGTLGTHAEVGRINPVLVELFDFDGLLASEVVHLFDELGVLLGCEALKLLDELSIALTWNELLIVGAR